MLHRTNSWVLKIGRFICRKREVEWRDKSEKWTNTLLSPSSSRKKRKKVRVDDKPSQCGIQMCIICSGGLFCWVDWCSKGVILNSFLLLGFVPYRSRTSSWYSVDRRRWMWCWRWRWAGCGGHNALGFWSCVRALSMALWWMSSVLSSVSLESDFDIDSKSRELGFRARRIVGMTS